MSASDARGIERRPTPHSSPGRGGESPRLVVLHTTAGSFESTAAWFAHPESGVSAHYLVALDGRVVQFVAERDTARHAGRILRPTAALAREAGPEGANPYSIGIEFEDAGDPLGVERPDAQYEAGARLIAAAAARWGIPLDREHVVGHRELFAAKECPGNLDVGRLVELARAVTPKGAAPRADRPRIACLLPVRDAAADIPGYLATAAALDARVIALDDGSADGTAELLAASPLVAELLHNPPRASHERWDDGANRAALLDAARELAPDWVLFLDADERIDPDDARALRRFLDSDALPGVAYGLELYRQWRERVVAQPTDVFRLFACRSDHELRPGRLHFNPVPMQIPRRAWVRTTIRARHLDSPERLARRRAKYAEADRAGSDTGPTAELLREPRGPLVEWRPRDPELAVLPSAPAHRSVAAPGAGDPRRQLTVLVPARNSAADIPGFLDCVRELGARVIALDDGSTDATAALLEASPLVARLLRNPRRETYAGWDDAANRQALLDAAAEDGSRWALFLDADERIAADDAAALRRFVEREADPSCAYGFRVHRMVGDEETYDRAGLWVYRLFVPAPGQRLPDRTLHLVPVPTSIPRERWRRTTIRIKHLASLDEERRRTRLRKYQEADPDSRWQSDYAGPLLAPGEARGWRPRPAGLPILADPAGLGEPLDLEGFDPEAPVLSAIVIATDDEATIERSVAAVLGQDVPLPFEVIVVVSGSPPTAAAVRRAFGERVTLVELERRVPPGRARNEGVRRARGEYLSFPGSHVEIAEGSLALRLEAHERGWAMVTGSIVNGNTTRPGWASYFLDHSSTLPGRPSGPLEGAPAHCSYVREFVVEAGGFPEDARAGEDTVLNQELWRRGHRAFREGAIRLTHRSPCSTTVKLIRHHFVRGRAFGRILRGDFDSGGSQTARPARALRGYVRRRLAVTDRRVADWGGELAAGYRRARPLVRVGVLAAWAGARFELAFGRSGRDVEHLGGRHRAEAAGFEAVEDQRQGDGGEPVAGVVQQHDRSGLR